MPDCPVIINVRDRVTPLRALVSWLERAGVQQIVLLDNDSSWPPLLDYLYDTPHQVVRLTENRGSRALWDAGLVPPTRFVLTDPDIIPHEDCPDDAVAYLHELMSRHGRLKVGLGLYLDDAEFPSKEWERQLVSPARQIAPGVYDSLVDTTFALYEAGAGFQYEALRTGGPYLARHASPAWYGGELSGEDRYYLAHATAGPLGSSWKETVGGFHETHAHAQDHRT